MSQTSGSLRDIFSQELSRIQDQKVQQIVVFTHRQADPDALCAASAFCDLLAETLDAGIHTKIIVPQGASSLGQSVCSQLGITYANEIEESNLQTADLVVVVDTGDPHLLEPFSDSIKKCGARKILIDHHSSSLNPATWPGFNTTFVNHKATSTCEIVVELFPVKHLSSKTAKVLLVGLMFDSQHLGIATESTLQAALTLVRAGAEIDSTRRILRSKASRSELLARLKSAQRLQFEEIGKYLIVKTEVSSFHASVARMLLEIGADVGIAFGESDGEVRISVRTSQSFYRETSIDMAEQVRHFSDLSGMIGGGHPTAVSLSGKGVAIEQANKLIQDLKNALPKL